MNNFNPKGDRSGNMNDGYYEIEYKTDGVYLTVFPPIGKGKRLEVKDILDRLTRKKVRNFNRSLIETSVIRSDKRQIKIATEQEEEKINSSVVFNISGDKMKASILFAEPDGGRMITLDEVKKSLNDNGIVYGVNEAQLEEIIKYPVYNEYINIAEGDVSIAGQNGKVQFLFNTSKDRKPIILEDGSVDFKNLGLIENITKGQMLCTITPPIQGVPGKTITGREISALSGKPAVLPKGRNVEITEDQKSIVASIDGQVCYIDGKINVFANYEVAADVDNSTGDISFVGNVIIRGNILAGFQVEAGGSVEVWGAVEGATIKAGGDIVLRRGIQGAGKGSITSGGDIIAKFIENSTVSAKNQIKSEAIMHSNVKCGKSIELSGRKGLLVGGVCKVGNEISAKVIGSQMLIVTDIELGSDPSLRDRYKEIKETVTEMENDLKKAEQAISLLRKLEISGALPLEKQEIMQKSVRTKVFYTNRIIESKEELKKIEEQLKEDVNGRIKASAYIYPGTKVAIGSCSKNIKEILQYCTLYRDGADIRVGPYDK